MTASPDTTEIPRIFALQQANQWNVKATGAEARKAKLAKLKAAVEVHADAIIAAVQEDTRKPAGEIRVTEVLNIVGNIQLAIENLDDMLANVPGIGFVLIGEGDLSQELGLARQYEHPEVLAAMAQIVATCHKHQVKVGNPHTTAGNYERLLKEGYSFLMTAPTRSYGVIGKAREMAGY